MSRNLFNTLRGLPLDGLSLIARAPDGVGGDVASTTGSNLADAKAAAEANKVFQAGMTIVGIEVGIANGKKNTLNQIGR